MTTNDILKEVHAAMVTKVAERCKTGDKGKIAAEIGTAIIDYGKTWTEGIADDGELSSEERMRICAKFAEIIDAKVPAADGLGVSAAYNGITFFGLGFKGIKYYLNTWFNLGLK